MEKLKKQVEEQLKNIEDEGVQPNNVDLLYRLIDIHKDIENEDYWKVKKEAIEMRYSENDNYNDGNYNRGNPYGRRGVRGSGRGRYSTRGGYNNNSEEIFDEMEEHYGRYSEGREYGRRGNYRAKEDCMKSLEMMLESTVAFIAMLEEEAESQEEVELIKHYAKKIGDM